MLDNDQPPPNPIPPEASKLNELNRDTSFVDKVYPHPVQVAYGKNPVVPEQTVTLPIAGIGEKKGTKRLWLITAVIAAAVVLASVLFGVYYFLFRIPDVEYQKTISIIGALETNAKALADYGAKTKNLSIEDMDAHEIDIQKSNVDEYNTHLKELKSSVVMQKDQNVIAAYSVVKKKVEDYGASSTKLYDTLTTYAGVVQRFSHFQNYSGDVKSIDDFNEVASDVENFATQHEEVGLKEFNDGYYQYYRDSILDYIAAARRFYVAKFAGDTAGQLKANTDIQVVMQTFQDKIKGKKYPLTNTFNPKDQLNDLRKSVVDRKNVFIR